jgi:hypothetical protein
LLKTLRRFRALGGAQRALLVEATLRLAAARLAVALLPFRVIARRLGQPNTESPLDARVDGALLRAVSWSIEAVSRRAPWRCKCLEQGITAKMMLRRRGVGSTLYLGVARREGQIEAHSWLRSGSVIVTGGGDVARFSIVSMFADGGSP